MQVDYNNYKDQDFICPKCNWAGKGQELSHGNFSEASFIGDLECPRCSHMITHWQAPLIDGGKDNNERSG